MNGKVGQNETSSNVHAEHRKRVREKCMRHGAECFDDHELLEIVLYYAIPRINTNTIAHDLLNKFGSIDGVMTAKAEQLKTVKGIGDNATVFINVLNEVIKRCNSRPASEKEKFNKISKIGEYLVNLYDRVTTERVYALMFDNSMRLLSAELISEGTVNGATVNNRLILEKAMSLSASAIVLSHNHPNGEPYPSVADLKSTKLIEKLLKLVGITLIDHIIVAGKEFEAITHTEQYLKVQDDPTFDLHSEISIPDDFYDK